MKKKILIIFMCGLVSACSTMKPFVDARREAGTDITVGQSTPDYIAICYNRFNKNEEEMQKMADAECAKIGSKAVLDASRSYTCTLVSPRTNYYRCVK